MAFTSRGGGDAHDIVRDPNIIVEKWKCPKCGSSWQNRWNTRYQSRPVDPLCPTCGSRLMEYWAFHKKQRQKRSWKLLLTECGAAVLLVLAGLTLFYFLEAGLIKTLLPIFLSIITFRVAFAMKDKRVYYGDSFYRAGDIWPSKAGIGLLFVVGVLYLGLFANAIFHWIDLPYL